MSISQVKRKINYIPVLPDNNEFEIKEINLKLYKYEICSIQLRTSWSSAGHKQGNQFEEFTSDTR